MADPAKPRYPHNCKHCTFLGRYSHGLRDYDLYRCSGGHFNMVVARYGEGPGQIATEPIELTLSPLNEARRRVRMTEAQQRARKQPKKAKDKHG